MADEAKHKVMASIGVTLTTGAPALAALGPIGLVAGLGLAALGAAMTTYGAYKLEPPREVWTPEKRAMYRAERENDKRVEAYDDETPSKPGAAGKP